jgi:hypothetical protein
VPHALSKTTGSTIAVAAKARMRVFLTITLLLCRGSLNP